MSRAAAFFVRDARLALSYPVDFWMPWATTVVTLLGFWCVSKLVAPSALLGIAGSRGSYFSYAAVNVAFFSVTAAAMQSFERAVRTDQIFGTLEAVLASPTRLSTLILCSALWPFALTCTRVIWYLLLAWAIFGLEIAHANVPLLLLFFALIVLTSSAIGIFGAAAVMRYKNVGLSNFLVGGAASLLSGVMFPVALLPAPLRAISWLLPFTHGLRGARAAVAGAAFGPVAGDALWLAVAAAVLLPLAFWSFRCAVEAAKRAGTLATY